MKIGLSLLVVALIALAQSPTQPRGGPTPLDPLPQRMSPVVQTCVPCHGTRGEGRPEAGYPRIAGQSALYLGRQLDSYAAGTRRDPTMEPIARGLPPDLRVEVSAYFAQTAAPAARGVSTLTAAWAERGRVLAVSGDPRRAVQACVNCHGPGGGGQPPGIPYLAGLDDGYIRATLMAWTDGRRRNDSGQQMAVIAKALSSDDVTAVARYYAAEPPPPPVPTNLVEAGRPRLLPAGMRRSIMLDTRSPDAAGSEGRAPMTGGQDGVGQTGESAETPGAGNTSGGSGDGRADTSASRARAGAASSSGDPVQGRALVASGAYGCTACHVVPGIRAPRGVVGPALGALAARPFIAGQLPNTFDVLVTFLRDPPSQVPATGMPDVGLSSQQARDIAAYLYSLPAAD